MEEHVFDRHGERLGLPWSSHDERQVCSLPEVTSGPGRTAAGLFAGIGGIERGLERSGITAELLCESWEPAHAVLAERFSGAELVGDVRSVRSLPKVDLVAAGFPCTDLSQAGRTAGIAGRQSGLVGEVFRLLRRPRAPMLLLENVRNMLVLDGGRAMRYLVDELEALGYRWAYRLVDSRCTGVPQRRQRVIFLASRDSDPRAVLFADDAGPRPDADLSPDLYGFYWTEGLRGLGWARDAVPTLKGGSTIGIPSPPGIWHRDGSPGAKIVTPSIEEAERLQGFPKGWTAPAQALSTRKGTRWRLVGNAVTVGVSEWVGRRVIEPGETLAEARPARGDRWPKAAYGERGEVWEVDVSMWPIRAEHQPLGAMVDLARAAPLSARGAAGFLSRAERGNLRFVEGFLEDVAEHADFMEQQPRVA